jgi:hypothetical protein
MTKLHSFTFSYTETIRRICPTLRKFLFDHCFDSYCKRSYILSNAFDINKKYFQKIGDVWKYHVNNVCVI